MTAKASKEKKLQWWQLSLLGVACTIGTGFFLGSSIAISMAGPAVIVSYALAAIGTFFVYEALAKLSINDPQKGSFRIYAKKAYGRWAGFTCGWVYWLSELLIMGSQLTALSIFSRFWFPDIPLWIFACGYSILGIIVILTGAKGFDRIENLLAVLKIAAIVMFIILAIVTLFGIFGKGTVASPLPGTFDTFMPNGWTGLMPSLIFGFYGFAGIEIIGLLAIRLNNMKDAIKAGTVMFSLLGVIYIGSLSLALVLLPWNEFHTEKSPFVMALNNYNIPYMADVFNGVFIIAGFSTMVASMFAMIKILVSLAEGNDAPHFLAKTVKATALPAIGVTTLAITASIILSLLMPGKIYEYFTTAAGLMLLYNWFFILGSYNRLLKLSFFAKFKRALGFLIILIAIVGTSFHHISRPGFFVSLLFIVVIGVITLIMTRIWKKNKTDKPENPEPGSLFTKASPRK